MKSTLLLRSLSLVLLLVLATSSTQAEENSPESASQSLLRVNSAIQFFNFQLPWIKSPPITRRGFGVVIDGGRVLVTADVVANATIIELEKAVTAEKSTAIVECADYDCNLAVLRPSDPSFIQGMHPLTLNGPLKVGEEASILQLEPNGDIAKTVGRITSISVAGYPINITGNHETRASLLLATLGASLQVKDSSWTMPVVRDNRLLGMVMRYDPAKQSSVFVPSAVIRHFLDELNSPAYQGFSRLGLGFAPLRDPQLRRYIGLQEPGGVYVSKITPSGSAEAAGLKTGDAILAVDGFPLDQDGNYVDPDYGRILFSHLTNTIKHPGAVVRFKVLRDRKTLEIPVTMQVAKSDEAGSETHFSDTPPKYVILGGLVFIELSKPYLNQGWGDKWTSNAPQRLVYYTTFEDELPPDRGRIIILSRVLPTPDTIGYEDLQNIVVTKVNGQTIKSLADLSEAAKKPINGFQKIEFEEDPKLLFLDAASIKANTDALKKHYSLPAVERL